MGPRAAAFSIFLVAFVAAPLPMVGLGGVFVPAARFAQLGAVALGLVAVEDAGGMVGVLTTLLLGHALVYGLLLGGIAWALGRRGLARVSPRVRGLGVGLACIVAVAFGIFGSPYDTPFHHTSAHAGLLELYW